MDLEVLKKARRKSYMSTPRLSCPWAFVMSGVRLVNGGWPGVCSQFDFPITDGGLYKESELRWFA